MYVWFDSIRMDTWNAHELLIQDQIRTNDCWYPDYCTYATGELDNSFYILRSYSYPLARQDNCCSHLFCSYLWISQLLCLIHHHQNELILFVVKFLHHCHSNIFIIIITNWTFTFIPCCLQCMGLWPCRPRPRVSTSKYTDFDIYELVWTGIYLRLPPRRFSLACPSCSIIRNPYGFTWCFVRPPGPGRRKTAHIQPSIRNTCWAVANRSEISKYGTAHPGKG